MWPHGFVENPEDEPGLSEPARGQPGFLATCARSCKGAANWRSEKACAALSANNTTSTHGLAWEGFDQLKERFGKDDRNSVAS